VARKPDFRAARAYARARLERELKPHYIYHSLKHTEAEVVRYAEQLALRERLPPHDIILVKTAAWFHDIGFVEQSDGHEMTSVRIALPVLLRLGYSPSDAERISEMIMATRLPQSPSSLCAMILADADLFVLGRSYFLQRNGELRLELQSLGKVFTDADWYRSQLKFLQSHQYFTASAQSLNNDGKAKNAASLNAMLIRAEELASQSV
jgi:uncharacterized protein